MACPLNADDDGLAELEEEYEKNYNNHSKRKKRHVDASDQKQTLNANPIQKSVTTSTSNTSSDPKPYTNCYYHDYLQLDKILDANAPRSGDYLNEPSHDEHLFITIHQAYEIWFKQILYELDSVISYLGSDILGDREILAVVSRLQRINCILKLLIEQFSVLDTMTPLDFLDFRKFLKPASGFQSIQFRILENKLGLNKQKRMRYNKQDYTKVLTSEHEQYIKKKCSNNKSLFNTIGKWLERFPYLESSASNWSFWSEYKSAVNNYILEEKELYMNGIDDIDDIKKRNQIRKELNDNYKSSISTFNTIFDVNKYNELLQSNKVRLSYTALQAALMIMLYRDEPILQMPFRIIELSMEMDNLLTQWRNKHALMVHRMLGSKMGTGGSSGFHYLRTAAIHHKVMADFFNLSTYMIPKSNLPQLPNSLRFFMNFPSSHKLISKKNKNIININKNKNKSKLTKDVLPFAVLKKAVTMSPKLFASTQNKVDNDNSVK